MKAFVKRIAVSSTLLLILSIASGCARSVPVSNFCLVAIPIYDSDDDTEETRRQIDDHWAVGESQGCDWPEVQ